LAIGQYVAHKELCRLVDRIYQRHKDMKAVAEALELLMPYTKAEGDSCGV